MTCNKVKTRLVHEDLRLSHAEPIVIKIVNVVLWFCTAGKANLVQVGAHIQCVVCPRVLKFVEPLSRFGPQLNST